MQSPVKGSGSCPHPDAALGPAKLSKLYPQDADEGCKGSSYFLRGIGISPNEGDKRQENTREAGTSNQISAVDRRKAERRKAQRREFFRIVYPSTAAPEVLDMSWRVADISKKGIKLVCEEGTGEHLASFGVDSPIALRLQFHDGETFDATGRVLRSYQDADSNRWYIVCKLDVDIPSERINKEQSFLLKHYPDFCRAAF